MDAVARAAAAEVEQELEDHEATLMVTAGVRGLPSAMRRPNQRAVPDAGVGTLASRDDHVHNVPNATTTLRGNSEKATGGKRPQVPITKRI